MRATDIGKIPNLRCETRLKSGEVATLAQQHHPDNVYAAPEFRRRLLVEWVEQLREKYGTDAAIAHYSGLDKSRISRWAKGDSEGQGISVQNMIRLAEISDLSLGDMMIAYYGVSPEQLVPTSTDTGVRVGTVVAEGEDGRFVRLAGDYRMMLLMREDSQPPTPDPSRVRR